ncbi:MAG: heme exporter protein CcmA, partial [candidate division NC10 bacterium]|nr:heme exporter protein CcmA [candidate division NC10 bacterium]
PELLFLDEPHNTLDQAAIALLNGYVASVRARGGSAIVATHNLSRAYDMADRFVLMREGAVTRRIEKDRLMVDQLREMYTRYAENDDGDPGAASPARRAGGREPRVGVSEGTW